MAEQARQMATKAPTQAREDELVGHAAVRPWAGFEQQPTREASPAHGRDMSQATVRSAAPLVGRDYAASTCPLAPTRCPYGGACHACPARVQAKIEINQPDEEYEQEADRVAGQITQIPARQVQRRVAGETGTAVAPPIVHEVLRSPGQPLDRADRAFMEPHFGHDFSHVRVHTDNRAAESTWAVNALAYTVGNNVVFGARQYEPQTTEGRRLIAHELTHVVQQGRNTASHSDTLEIGPSSGDPNEQEAAETAIKVSSEQPLAIQPANTRSSLHRLQRHPQQDTHAGLFELTRHRPTGGPTFSPQSQYDVRLEFLPYDIVDCDQIALTQTAVGSTAGVLAFASAARRSRSLSAAEGTEGVGIDRLSGRSQPYYGTENTGAASPGMTHFGSHTPRAHADRAWLEDAPGFDGSTPASSRTPGMTDSTHFETCAICTRGRDQTAYYGCVSWGYDIDAANKFTEDTFGRVSKGTPSADFLAAARKWNAQTVPVATTDLPIPGHATRNTHMTRTELDAEIRSLATTLKGLAAGHANIPQITFELRVLRDIRDAIQYNEDQHYLHTEVRIIQKKVGAAQDGTWGYDTIRRVKIWQAGHGLRTDGRVGPETLEKMGLHRAGDYPLPDTSPTATRMV